jgi:hypothetical protein
VRLPSQRSEKSPIRGTAPTKRRSSTRWISGSVAIRRVTAKLIESDSVRTAGRSMWFITMSEETRPLTDEERDRLQPLLDDTEIPVRVTAEEMALDDEDLIAVAGKAVGLWPFEREIILRDQCFDYSDEELLGLLAHEIGHHRGHHGLLSRVVTVGSVVVCLPVLLALAFGGIGGGIITGRWLVVLGSVLAMILLAGAIMLGSARVSRSMEFNALQPHKGSSETILPANTDFPIPGFNPTRVRLKLDRFIHLVALVIASTPQGFV